MQFVSDKNIIDAWDGDIPKLLDILETGFLQWRAGEILQPEKSSQILNAADQTRVNCMPATLLSNAVSGVKLVSVFPGNAQVGKKNVSGAVLLLDATDGSPRAVMGAALVTALRTALVSGVAARRLAASNPKKLAVLGSGEQAKYHAVVLCALFPHIQEVAIASRTAAHAEALASELARAVSVPSVHAAASYAEAVTGADLIVTAISAQEPVLKADWIKPGATYFHVGGYEDEYAVVQKADKIVCDSWPALKHRGSPTLAHMYRDGLLTDSDIYAELSDLFADPLLGRTSNDEFIYFNAIGLGFTDMLVASELLRQCEEKRQVTSLEIGEGDILANAALLERFAGAQ